MEGEWSCYRGGQFNGVRMVVTKVLFNGGGMVMLERWLVLKRENDHVTEVSTSKEGEWSCYGGCHFNGGRKGHQRVRGGQFNGGRIG